MRDYPACQCPNLDIHLPHTAFFEGRLVSCGGVGDNQEYVYRLVSAETGEHLKCYGGQYVYSDRGQARGQCTKYNQKYWTNDKAVIQRGLIQWSTDPV